MSDQLAKLVAVLEARGAEVTIRKIRDVGEEGKRTGKKLENMGERSNKSFTALAGRLGLVAAAATGVYKALGLVGQATMVAARVETLGVVVRNVGKNAGYMSDEISKAVQKVEQLGITSRSAMQGLTRGMQSGLEPDDVAKLARAAQDAAVVMGTDSSAGLDRLIHGITTAQIEVLRTVGILVNFESEYANAASAINKTANQLSEQEKIQIRVNAVLREAGRLQGNYEEAMTTASKQMGSLTREWETFLQKLGERTQETFFNAVKTVRSAVQEMTEIVSVASTTERIGQFRGLLNFADRTDAANAGRGTGGALFGGALGFINDHPLSALGQSGFFETGAGAALASSTQNRRAALNVGEGIIRTLGGESSIDSLLQARALLAEMIAVADDIDESSEEYRKQFTAIGEKLAQMNAEAATMATPEEINTGRAVQNLTGRLGRLSNNLRGQLRGMGTYGSAGSTGAQFGAGGDFAQLGAQIELLQGSNDPAIVAQGQAALEQRNRIMAEARAVDAAALAKRIRGQEKELLLLQMRADSQGKLTEEQRVYAEIALGSLAQAGELEREALLSQARRQDALEQEIKTQERLAQARVQEANNVLGSEDLIEQLEAQLRLTRMTSDERASMLNIERLNGDATEEQKARIEELTTELLRTNRRLEIARQLSDQFSNTLVDGIRRGKLELEDFGNVLLNMLSRMAANQIQENLLGPLFSGAASLFGGGSASGVPLMARGGITDGVSIAGEAGPEAVIPLPDGRSVPVTMKGTAGPMITVNVTTDGSVAVDGGSDDADARQFGEVIGMLVRDEIQKQQRPGGLLRRG